MFIHYKVCFPLHSWTYLLQMLLKPCLLVLYGSILSSLFKIPLAILWGIGGRGRSGRRPTDEDAAGVRCEKSDTDANAARQRVLSFTALWRPGQISERETWFSCLTNSRPSRQLGVRSEFFFNALDWIYQQLSDSIVHANHLGGGYHANSWVSP